MIPLNYKIITIGQQHEWEKYVRSSNNYDFYHTLDYHKLDNSGEPFLFVFEEDGYFIALPLLKREITGTPYFDCTSVYGYPGPVTNFPAESLNSSVVLNFRSSLTDYLLNARIISVFSRFHPFIDANPVWDNLGNIVYHGRTVTIDLNQSLEDQRKQYQRTTRARVRQLSTLGYTVREAESDEDLQSFVKIYHENMNKVHASSYYYFDEAYFKSLLNSTSFVTKLFLCCDQNKVTAGAIITFTKEIMQLHLSATNNEYLKICPIKLLIDEITSIGRNTNMKYLHMGGGVGGNEDSLFAFKAGFSKKMTPFKTWRHIADEAAYNRLVLDRGKQSTTGSDYFPLYREGDAC